jgi:hypothetical protein
VKSIKIVGIAVPNVKSKAAELSVFSVFAVSTPDNEEASQH